MAGGMASRSMSGEEQRRADQIWQALQPVSDQLREFDRLTVAELADLIEQARAPRTVEHAARARCHPAGPCADTPADAPTRRYARP